MLRLLNISFPINHSKQQHSSLLIFIIVTHLTFSLYIFSQAHAQAHLSTQRSKPPSPVTFLQPHLQMATGRRKRKGQQGMQRFSICQHMVTFFVIASVLSMLCSLAQGRTVPYPSEGTLSQGAGEEEAKVIWSRIGSRPPRCAGRCYSCGHCEAIQVPTNPQVAKAVAKQARAGVSTSTTTTAYFRGDYGSNYKPMSWKCKCGNSIFNP